LFDLKKRKILTEVITPSGAYTKKFPVEGEYIIIKPETRRTPAYRAKFNRDCIIYYWRGIGPFKKLCQKLLLIEGADHCVSFKFKGNIARIEMPVWDRATEEHLFRMSVIKAAGATVHKLTLPFFAYLILAIIIFLQLLTILVASGRVEIAI